MRLDRVQRKAFNEFNYRVYSQDIKIQKISRCFCGATDFLLLSKYDRFGLPFGTQICEACGLVTQNYRIDPLSLDVFYNEIYWPLVAGANNFSTPPKQKEETPLVTNYINTEVAKLTVFEIGCGSGNRSIALRRSLQKTGQEATLYGVDYSTEAVEIAKARGITAEVGDIEFLHKFGKCNVLILSHIFEHFPDLDLSLKQLSKLCDESTLVYVEVPGINDLENKKEYLYDYQTYCVLAHTFNFSLTTLSNVFGKYGFRCVYGDEYVRAVFCYEPSYNHQDVSGFDDTTAALKRASKKHLQLKNSTRFKVSKYLKSLVRAGLKLADS